MIRDDIEGFTLLNTVKPGAKAKMIQYGIVKRYGKKEIIFLDKAELNRIYILLEGYVALYKLNKNQERKVIFVLGPGELLNEECIKDATVATNCCVIESAKVLYFTRKQWRELLETDSEFAFLIYSKMAEKLKKIYRQLSNTTNAMRLEQQVATKLWKLARDRGVPDAHGDLVLPFDLTISFLADMLGSKRESVSRVVKKYNDLGIVTFSRGTCRIHKMDLLQKITLE